LLLYLKEVDQQKLKLKFVFPAPPRFVLAVAKLAGDDVQLVPLYSSVAPV
jgi:hypothetical protein